MIEMQSLTFSILVILAILSLADCEILRLECETYANFSVIHENRRQIGATVRILLATDGLTCKLECSREPRCKSINVNDYEEICELNDKSAMDPIDRVVTTSSTGWILYSPSYDEQLVGINCRKHNPCADNQKCIDSCACPGYKCIGSDAIYSSCLEALRTTSKTLGKFHIQHQGMNKFIVAECKIEDNDITAVFHHDCEETTTVHGFEATASYRRTMSYNNSKLDDLKLFVDSSSSCRQFTRIDCHGMGLIHGYLLDRNYAIMKYFGGGPQDGTGCKCGIDKSCAYSGWLCNCYANDNVWRYDEGYVTDKQRLPLTEVRLGDTGGWAEYGKHTIGPMICTETRT